MRLILPLFSFLLTHTFAVAAPPAVTAAVYHPQGKTLALGAGDRIWVFPSDRAEPISRITIPSERITALAYDPQGKYLAVAGGESGKEGLVWLFALEADWRIAGSPRATLVGHKDSVYALAFAPNGTMLASGGYDRVIRLWQVPSPGGPPAVIQAQATLADHSDTVYGLSFHPDGKLLASAAADRAVKVWDVASGKRLYTLGDPTDWVYAVAWSPDRKHLAAAGVDKSVRVWAADANGGKLVHSVFAHDKPVARLAYASDGLTLYSVGEDRAIKAWNTSKMTETAVFPPQPETVLAMALRPDGRQLAVGRFDGVAALIDTTSRATTAQLLPAKPLPPKAAKLMPAAGVRGTTTRVTASGANLDYATRVTSSSNLVAAKIDSAHSTPDRLALDVSIDPSAAIGPVQLVIEGEAGKSPALMFAVDRFPSVSESGISDSARVAQAVKLPVSIAGGIDRAGDADYFRFEARAGDQIGVQVLAAEFGSKLDPAIVLTDGVGKVMAEGTTSLGFKIPATASYAIGIRDRDYRGAADMTYRLHIGNIPVVTGVFPLAVQRGHSSVVYVEGVNLGPSPSLQSRVTVPADAAAGSRIPVPLPGLPEKPLGAAMVLAAEFPSVVMNPEGETELRVPGSADGILTHPSKSQTARFLAKKGHPLAVEVLAGRAGSPVDSVVEILDGSGRPVPRAVLRSTAKTYVTFRDHDSTSTGIRLETWNELAIDDYLLVDGELVRILALPKGPDDDAQFYQVGGRRVGFLGTTPAHHSQGRPMYKVEIHPPGTTFPPNGLPVVPLYYRNDDGGAGFGKDSFLIFDPPADGAYQVRVSDARSAGGPTHAYRVTVRPPRPDFSVSFSPSAPSVWKGGGIPITATINRVDGFDGPVAIHLEGLPSGFHALPTTIEAGQSTTAFTLFADAPSSSAIAAPATAPSAPPSSAQPAVPLKLVAQAMIGGNEVIHESMGAVPKLLDGGDLVTRTRDSELTIRPGQETRFVVEIERQGKFAGRVPLDVRGLPHGVRVQNIGLNGILINEKETSREVVLYAEPWVQPMTRPLVVLSRSESKGAEHASKAVVLRVVK